MLDNHFLKESTFASGKFFTGFLPDIPDSRDYKFSDLMKKQGTLKVKKEKVKRSIPLKRGIYRKSSYSAGEEFVTISKDVPTKLLASISPYKVDHSINMSSVKNQGHLGCHDINTEILTENGWKSFEELNQDEKVATINPSTHELEYQKPINYIEYNYEGKMFYFNHGSGLNAMVTPNHKMYVRKWDSKNAKIKENYEFVEAENIGWYSGLLTCLSWEKESPEFIKMPDVEIEVRNGSSKQSIRKGEDIKTNDFVCFLGLYLAEGCCYLPENSSSYRIEIAASDNNIRKEEVIKIIDALPYKYTIYHDRITIWNKSLFTFLHPFGNIYTKSVPRFIMDLNKNDILSFLYGYHLGDGSFHKNGETTAYAVSEKLIDDVQELSLKIGRWARKTVRDPRITYIKGRKIISKKCYELYTRMENTKLSIDKKKGLDIVPYNNKVYCVEVPNHILITRREGCMFVSGNSCVAFSGVAMKEFQEKIEHEKEVTAGKEYNRDTKEYDYSEQWLYWNCKKIDGIPNTQGTYIRTALKVLNKIGVPIESAWAYSDSNINIGKPKRWANLIARWAVVGSYWSVNNLTELKAALIDGPVVLGVPVFEEWRNPSDGYIKYPSKKKALGGHAICVTGYNNETEHIKFKNSWSTRWGYKGYGYLSYKYINDFFWGGWVAKDISVTRNMLKGTRTLI